MKGRALRVGLGCTGQSRTGPTLVLYLRGVGAATTEAWGAAVAIIEPTAVLPWAAAVVVVGAGTTAVPVVVTAVAAVGGGTIVVAGWPRLEPLTGGGEDCLTLGRKLCPPRVFTMARLEKKKRWRGWEEEGFHK